jgi:opacity protein-like surface antigen
MGFRSAGKYAALAFALCSAALVGTTQASAQQAVVGGGLTFTDIGDFDLGLQVNGYLPLEAVPGLRLGGDFTYFLPQSESFMGASISANFFAINANAQYFFVTGDEFNLYGLGGLSIGRFSISGSEPGYGRESVSNTEMGLNLGGGGEFATGFGAIFGELKLVTGDYDRFTIAAGVRVPLGR